MRWHVEKVDVLGWTKSKETSNTDNLAVSEEANVDEAITAESKSGNEM